MLSQRFFVLRYPKHQQSEWYMLVLNESSSSLASFTQSAFVCLPLSVKNDQYLYSNMHQCAVGHWQYKLSRNQRISTSMSGRAHKRHKLEPRLYKRTLRRPVAKELTLLGRALGVHRKTICSNLFSQSSLTLSTRFYWIISSESLKVNAVSTVSAFLRTLSLKAIKSRSDTF